MSYSLDEYKIIFPKLLQSLLIRWQFVFFVLHQSGYLFKEGPFRVSSTPSNPSFQYPQLALQLFRGVNSLGANRISFALDPTGQWRNLFVDMPPVGRGNQCPRGGQKYTQLSWNVNVLKGKDTCLTNTVNICTYIRVNIRVHI